MNAIFIELPAFARHRDSYLNDDAYKAFQQMMLEQPESGDVIQGTGGLRKVRFEDKLRQKGKRGGLRVIYYWRSNESQFWLFTIYNKDELDNLSAKQRDLLKIALANEIEKRNSK